MHIRSALAAAGLALMAQATHAQTFVGGIPAGWDCQGNCGTAAADGDVTPSPTGAARFGYVVTDTEVQLGLSPFARGGEDTGARLRSTSFAANPGDALKFQFNYITSDGDEFTDYAWARLLNANDLSQAALLFTARTQPSGSIVPGFDLPMPEATLTPASVPIIPKVPGTPTIDDGPIWSVLGSDSGQCFASGCGYTGWVQSSFTIAAGGNYILEFGVVNVGDEVFQSGLAFDGITIADVPIVA